MLNEPSAHKLIEQIFQRNIKKLGVTDFQINEVVAAQKFPQMKYSKKNELENFNMNDIKTRPKV
ncbi:MAG: hypothetical protein RSB39_05035, partial [Oscillospiraceae bacterium]